MNARSTMRMACVLPLAIFCGAGFDAAAQAVRVSTIDMASAVAAEKSPAAAIEKTAEQFKKLSPDVIIARGVPNWKMCSQLAAALKPAEYRVLVCSAFRDGGSTNLLPNQVGIIAKNAHYLAWCEQWSSQTEGSGRGGFAFAAAQVGGHRWGFCALELPKGKPPATEQAIAQWNEMMNTFRGWNNNRLEGFVAGVFGTIPADGEAARTLRRAGFIDPVVGGKLTAGQPVEAHLLPNADAAGGLLLSRWPMTCDFDFRPAPIIVVASNAVPEVATQGGIVPGRNSRQSLLGWAIIGLGVILLAIIMMLLGIRRKLSRLQAQGALLGAGSLANSAGALGYNVAVAPPALPSSSGEMPLPVPRTDVLQTSRVSSEQQFKTREGLFAHLSQWLKHAIVQRLLVDRKSLLESQQAATMKVLAVDERLAKLELKIQEETSSYEKQIEQLNRELLTAREENLELIRGQIKLLKEEMEDARRRVMESEAL